MVRSLRQFSSIASATFCSPESLIQTLVMTHSWLRSMPEWAMELPAHLNIIGCKTEKPPRIGSGADGLQ